MPNLGFRKRLNNICVYHLIIYRLVAFKKINVNFCAFELVSFVIRGYVSSIALIIQSAHIMQQYPNSEDMYDNSAKLYHKPFKWDLNILASEQV